MDKLIFVYNADSGLANALLDTGRRVFRPQDYPCALCLVTYGPFGMKKDWLRFVQSLPYEVSFLHKDQLAKSFPKLKLTPPGLVHITGSTAKVLMERQNFENIASLEDLKQKVYHVQSGQH